VTVDLEKQSGGCQDSGDCWTPRRQAARVDAAKRPALPIEIIPVPNHPLAIALRSGDGVAGGACGTDRALSVETVRTDAM